MSNDNVKSYELDNIKEDIRLLEKEVYNLHKKIDKLNNKIKKKCGNNE